MAILLLLIFVLSIFFSYFIQIFSQSKKFNLDKNDIFSKYILLNIFSSSIFSYICFLVINFDQNLIFKILILLIIFFIQNSLLYLTYFDFLYFEIPNLFSLILPALALLLNLVLIFFNRGNSIELWNNNFYNPTNNIIAMLIAGLFIFFIVLITKGKGMGEGDIRLAALLGLIVGVDKLLVSFYIIIFSASIVGIVIAIKNGKLKGLKIPFVPFIVLGTIVSFLFGNTLNLYLFKLLGIG